MQPARLNFTATTVNPFAQTIPKEAPSKGLQKESPKVLQPILLQRFSHPKPHFQKWSEGSGAHLPQPVRQTLMFHPPRATSSSRI